MAALPFAPTAAQRRAVEEITADFARGTAMNRLLQGDVGSGKTLVAAAAACLAVQNGLQAAIMAPTEILAEQHLTSFAAFLAPLGIKPALLTGSLSAGEKRRIKEGLAGGTIPVVVGTHALLTEDVAFQNLGLVVADEQHRFGVAQRAALRAKGTSPHLLVMSATPIPRTLAMMLYGDLDVSILDELPPGRQKVDTFLVGEAMRPRINAFIRKQPRQATRSTWSARRWRSRRGRASNLWRPGRIPSGGWSFPTSGWGSSTEGSRQRKKKR